MDSFGVDLKGIFAVCASVAFVFLLYRIKKQFPVPSMKISSISTFFQDRQTLRESIVDLPRQLMLFSLICSFFAMMDPHLFIDRKPTSGDHSNYKEEEIPKEGIALYLVVDISGSMQQPITPGSRVSKLEFLKNIVDKFITERPQDLLGLIAFSRGASVVSPLTLDHEMLLKKLRELAPVASREFDGTAIGYAIYKTVNLISSTRHYAETHQEKGKPAYEIKSVGLVLVTDGLQNPSELDNRNPLRNIELVDAAAYAKENNVKLYLINIGSEITMEKYQAHRNVMQKIAERTGGKFYIIKSPNTLSEVFEDINTLETSRITEKVFTRPKDLQPEKFRRLSFSVWILAAAAVSLIAAALLETLWIRRIP